MEFKCKRCNATFNKKILLIKHLKKIKACSVHDHDIERDDYLKSLVFDKNKFEIFKCSHCNKEFTKNTNRYRHQKSCPNKPSSEQDQQYSQLIEKDSISKYDVKDRGELIEIIRKLESKLNLHKPVSIVNNNTNCHNIVNNVHIHNYGSENIEHLENSLVQRFLHIDLPKLIRDIHYNPNIPENMNFRLQNDYIEKRFNNRWVKYDMNDGIHQLIIDKAKILERVPKNNAKYLVHEHVEDSIDELKQIKENAINQEENTLFFDVYYRLHKEEQKAIAIDQNSDQPYCYFKSNSGSDEELFGGSSQQDT